MLKPLLDSRCSHQIVLRFRFLIHEIPGLDVPLGQLQKQVTLHFLDHITSAHVSLGMP